MKLYEVLTRDYAYFFFAPDENSLLDVIKDSTFGYLLIDAGKFSSEVVSWFEYEIEQGLASIIARGE